MNTTQTQTIDGGIIITEKSGIFYANTLGGLYECERKLDFYQPKGVSEVIIVCNLLEKVRAKIDEFDD